MKPRNEMGGVTNQLGRCPLVLAIMKQATNPQTQNADPTRGRFLRLSDYARNEYTCLLYTSDAADE